MYSSGREMASDNDKKLTFWECRYFFLELPSRFSRQNLYNIFPQGANLHEFEDEDIYLIGSDATQNIKIRKRRRTIKVKQLIDYKRDGFELWRNEFEYVLPITEAVWRAILALLRVEGDSHLVSTCSDPEQTAELLQNMCPYLTQIRVSKSRTIYDVPPSHVDISKATVGTKVLHSVEFESPELSLARSIRSKFYADDLELPTSYVSLFTQIYRLKH